MPRMYNINEVHVEVVNPQAQRELGREGQISGFRFQQHTEKIWKKIKEIISPVCLKMLV